MGENTPGLERQPQTPAVASNHTRHLRGWGSASVRQTVLMAGEHRIWRARLGTGSCVTKPADPRDS